MFVFLPKNKSSVPDSCNPSMYYQEQVSVIDGILYKNSSIVIPEKLRKKILQRIHSGHMGIECTKESVRNVLFWPGMSSDIKSMIE